MWCMERMDLNFQHFMVSSISVGGTGQPSRGSIYELWGHDNQAQPDLYLQLSGI